MIVRSFIRPLAALASALTLLSATGCLSPRMAVRHLDATTHEVVVVVDGVGVVSVVPGDEKSVDIRPGQHAVAMCVVGQDEPRAAFVIEVEDDVTIDISPSTNTANDDSAADVREHDTDAHMCSQARQSMLAR